MNGDQLLEVLAEAVDAVAGSLSGLADWGLAGTRPGQYRSDLVADAAAVRVLTTAGLGVLSEESGLSEGASELALLAVLDPVDGSTNASRRIPWFATSICVLDDDGPLAAMVVNQATGTRYEAVRRGGARRDGEEIAPSGEESLGRSLIGLSGYPPRHLGWRWYRSAPLRWICARSRKGLWTGTSTACAMRMAVGTTSVVSSSVPRPERPSPTPRVEISLCGNIALVALR